ncbi:MAG: recombination protein RecO [Wolinella sp.]
MQGFVVDIRAVREEDLWVSVLTPRKLARLYRFYGARHSVIQIGHKIDFEEDNDGVIPRLRHVMHLGYTWEQENPRRYAWQQYLRLLYVHLRDVGELEEFYCVHLDELARKIVRQDPRRAVLEAYASMLLHEGRTHALSHCSLCEGELSSEVVVGRGFIGAHPECASGESLSLIKVEWFLNEQNSTHLDERELDELWSVLLRGL